MKANRRVLRDDVLPPTPARAHRDLQLREILATKCVDLFTAYGKTVSMSTAMDCGADDQAGAVLGFSGAALSGAVMVVASLDALDESNPIPGASITSWLGELTNQLVGRFKNALLARGIDVGMSIPVVLTASRIRPLARNAIEEIVLLVGTGTVMVWLEVDGDAEFVEPSATAEPLATEGDILLF